MNKPEDLKKIALVERRVSVTELGSTFPEIVSTFTEAYKKAEKTFGSQCVGFRLEQDAGYNNIQSTIVFMSPMTEEERVADALKKKSEGVKEDKKKAARRKKWLELNKEFSTEGGD